MWELAHGLEWVAGTGLVATLVAPHVAIRLARRAASSSLLSFAIVLLLSVARRGHGAPRH